MFESFKPITTHVFVKFINEELTTEGGFVLPGDKDASYKRGSVLAVGPEIKDIKPGDVCIFGKFAGLPLEGAYCILDIKEIYGIL